MSDDALPTGAAADVNDRVEEAWFEETTAFERVHEVVRRTYDPAPADELAERARVSPTTARKHLRTLASAGEVTETEGDGRTLYRRSETAIVTEHADALLAERNPEEIAAGIAELKATIREWRETYDVESPEELARTLDVVDADDEDAGVVTEWQTTRRNLALAQAALAIGEARQGGHLSTGDGDASLVG